MGKIYQFPDKQKQNGYKPPIYSEEQLLIKSVVQILTESYSKRIEELQGYQQEIKKADGKHLKNPKELVKCVRELDKMFYKYGISSNFYRFVTLEDTQVLYFTDRKLVYVYEGADTDKMKHYAIGEFIKEFEYYGFTLMLDDKVYQVLDRQREELEITTKVLNNTKI